ncbi:hypothetical protein BUH_6859 [Burkholderia pseudomallei Pakistan 9]|nr:hypothetical protein BUH_6859 [Burkholderia pseudomallei Pakistan 9]
MALGRVLRSGGDRRRARARVRHLRGLPALRVAVRRVPDAVRSRRRDPRRARRMRSIRSRSARSSTNATCATSAT